MNTSEDMFEEFRVEMVEIAEAIDESMLRWERFPDDLELSERIFRQMHTLKGSAGFLELFDLANLCHAAEDVFAMFRAKPRAPTRHELEVLTEAVTSIRYMLGGSRSDKPAGLEDLIARVKALTLPTPATGRRTRGSAPPTTASAKRDGRAATVRRTDRSTSRTTATRTQGREDAASAASSDRNRRRQAYTVRRPTAAEVRPTPRQVRRPSPEDGGPGTRRQTLDLDDDSSDLLGSKLLETTSRQDSGHFTLGPWSAARLAALNEGRDPREVVSDFLPEAIASVYSSDALPPRSRPASSPSVPIDPLDLLLQDTEAVGALLSALRDEGPGMDAVLFPDLDDAPVTPSASIPERGSTAQGAEPVAIPSGTPRRDAGGPPAVSAAGVGTPLVASHGSIRAPQPTFHEVPEMAPPRASTSIERVEDAHPRPGHLHSQGPRNGITPSIPEAGPGHLHVPVDPHLVASEALHSASHPGHRAARSQHYAPTHPPENAHPARASGRAVQAAQPADASHLPASHGEGMPARGPDLIDIESQETVFDVRIPRLADLDLVEAVRLRPEPYEVTPPDLSIPSRRPGTPGRTGAVPESAQRGGHGLDPGDGGRPARAVDPDARASGVWETSAPWFGGAAAGLNIEQDRSFGAPMVGEEPIALPGEEPRPFGPASAHASDLPDVPRGPAREVLEPGGAQADESGILVERATTVRVDVAKLDTLLNLVGDLLQEKHRQAAAVETLMGALGKHEFAISMSASHRRLDRLLHDLQEAVLGTRMLPVRGIFRRYPRIVKDLAARLGKEVELMIAGEETEIDRALLEGLFDPLIHLLRNSIDHGIEAPADRVRRGKPRWGTISLAATHEGNQIVLEIRDDGRGINPHQTADRAIAMGLLDPDRAKEMNDQEKIDLIFLPGFTSRETATETSGRGVGMSVVRDHLRRIGGLITVHSRPGEGTTLRIVMPLTLAILQILLVKVGPSRYAIPLSSVVGVQRIERERLTLYRGGWFLPRPGSMLPLYPLSGLLEHEPPGLPPERCYVAEVGVAEKRYGIWVDGFAGIYESVIKSLEGTLTRLPGVAGGTFIGAGEMVLVLDVGTLLEGQGAAR